MVLTLQHSHELGASRSTTRTLAEDLALLRLELADVTRSFIRRIRARTQRGDRRHARDHSSLLGRPRLLYVTVDSVRAQTDPDWTLIDRRRLLPRPVGRAVLRSARTTPASATVRNETNLGIAANFERCRRLASRGPRRCSSAATTSCTPTFVSRARNLLTDSPGRGDPADGRPRDRRVRQRRPLPLARPDQGTAAAPSGTDPGAVRRGPRGEPASRQLALLAFAWSSGAAGWSERPFREDLPIVLDLALIMDVVRAGGTLVLDP